MRFAVLVLGFGIAAALAEARSGSLREQGRRVQSGFPGTPKVTQTQWKTGRLCSPSRISAPSEGVSATRLRSSTTAVSSRWALRGTRRALRARRHARAR